MNYLPPHPSAFGLQDISKTSSVPFKTHFPGNTLQDTLSKESLHHTNSKQANNKSFKPAIIPSGSRAQTSTHGKHSSYQEHHHRGENSAESSLKLPTLPTSATKNNFEDKSSTLQSPKGNEINGFDFTGKFASFSKKRTIRVQSKNKFPSDFFESNQPDDIGFQTFNEHARRNSQQNDEFPMYFSNSTNKPYTSSNPMKFSLPIPSPQVHFDTEDNSKQQTKLEENKEVTENKNSILKQQAHRIHSATTVFNEINDSVTRNNIQISQTNHENELPLNNTLQKQITSQTPIIGQIFTKNSSTSKNNNNNLKHQNSSFIPAPQQTPTQLQSKQPPRLSSPKDKLLPPRLASPKNTVTSNPPQDALKTYNSNKLPHSDPKTDQKPLMNLEQLQRESLDTNPINKITDEVLEQLCTSVSGKRIQINNQLVPQHPQSSHVLQRPKQNQNNKSGSNLITNTPSNNIKSNNTTATKRMLNYEVKMTSNNLHEAINKNAFSCKSVEKRERHSLILPHSKERPIECQQKQPTETSGIVNNQDEKNSMLKRNTSGQRSQGIIVRNAKEQQQNQQNLMQQQSEIIKPKGTASNIDFSNFKIPLNQIGKKIKEGGAMKFSEKGNNSNSNDTNNVTKFKSSTLEGKQNQGQKIVAQIDSESQQSRKQKQRPQSMKVTEEMKNKMLLNLTENASDQQLKAEKQCQHMNARNNKSTEKQEDLLFKLMPSSTPPPPVPSLRSAQSHEVKTNAEQQLQADRSLINMTNSFEKEEEHETDPISENYNKTANFTSMQDIGTINSTPVTGRLKSMKSQPKIAVNLKECEKYKPFLIRKVSSQCSMRAKQQSVQSSGSPNSSSSLQTFTFDFNKNYSGSTNPGGPSQVSSPTLLASNEQFNSHEFSFSHQ